MNAAQSTRVVGQSSDSRINALAAANAAYDGYQAVGAAGAAMSSGQVVGITATVGSQKSSSRTQTDASEAVGSTVAAAGRVDMVATGAGGDSDIRISGSTLQGGAGTGLYADGAIDIVAAQNRSAQHTESSSSGWNAGVAVSGGSSGWAAGITAGVNAGKGREDGETVTQVNSHVGGGGTTTLISGGNTTIRGGQVTGDRVEVEAAHLAIESAQDTATYTGEQKNASAQVTVGYGFSASGSYSQSKLDSSYASVVQQSGILAGDGGYEVNIAGSTDLQGAIITSTAAAEVAGLNRLSTGTLSASNIENHADYSGASFGVSGGLGKNGKGEQREHQMAMGSADGVAGGRSSGKSVGLGSTGDNQSSTTVSGISTSNLVITDVDGQAATGKTVEQIKAGVVTMTSTYAVATNSGALSDRFDADTVMKELNIQVQVTRNFQQNSRGMVNAYADAKQAALREQIKQATTEEEKTVLYDEIYKLQYQRRFLETVINIVSADPAAAITQGTLQLAATAMREETLANSRKSPGMVIDANGTVINNVSYDSGAFDGVKLGGVRLDTETICGEGNIRCANDGKGNLLADVNGNYKYIGDERHPTYESFEKDLKASKDMHGPTGGFQPVEGAWYLPFNVVIPYKSGSFSDRLVEAFAGTHDLLGGQIWGWYGSDGNTAIDRTKPQKLASGVTTVVAIPVAAPFALSDLVSSDVIQILIKLGRLP
ncbi:hemagglutinin repeat-containing protein [Stenotrophomonas capsici]